MRQDFRLVLDVIEGRLVYEPAESAPESASGDGEIVEPAAALEPEKVDQMGLFE
jgi:hypothetical protein